MRVPLILSPILVLVLEKEILHETVGYRSEANSMSYGGHMRDENGSNDPHEVNATYLNKEILHETVGRGYEAN